MVHSALSLHGVETIDIEEPSKLFDKHTGEPGHWFTGVIIRGRSIDGSQYLFEVSVHAADKANGITFDFSKVSDDASTKGNGTSLDVPPEVVTPEG